MVISVISYQIKVLKKHILDANCHLAGDFGCWSILTGLYHPPDGVTNPEYKLLRFIQLTKLVCKKKRAPAFNWDRCCHLVLCLQVILFHCTYVSNSLKMTNYNIVKYHIHVRFSLVLASKNAPVYKLNVWCILKG